MVYPVLVVAMFNPLTEDVLKMLFSMIQLLHPVANVAPVVPDDPKKLQRRTIPDVADVTIIPVA